MRFYFTYRKFGAYAGTITGTGNDGGRLRIAIDEVTKYVSVGDSVSIVLTGGGENDRVAYKVYATDSDTYYTLDTPYISGIVDTSFIFIGLPKKTINLLVGDVPSDITKIVTSYTPFVDRFGNFSIDISNAIQSVFPDINKLSDHYDSVTGVFTGLNKWFILYHQDGCNIIDYETTYGNTPKAKRNVVFRASDFLNFTVNKVLVYDYYSPITPSNDNKVNYLDNTFGINHRNDMISPQYVYNPDFVYYGQIVWNDSIQACNINQLIDLGQITQTNSPLYNIAWMNRAGFIISYPFCGVSKVSIEQGENQIYTDEKGQRHIYGRTSGTKKVEITSGQISLNEYEALKSLKTAIHAWEVVAGNNVQLLPIIISSDGAEDPASDETKIELRLSFEYCDGVGYNRQ